MSAWAKPGVKCVCVDAAMLDGDDAGLIVGGIYTITRVLHTYADGGKYPGEQTVLALAGVKNPFHRSGAFSLARFRPLITLDQDIALFAHHLDGVGVPA